MGKKRRRLENRTKRQATGTESPADVRKPGDGVLPMTADGFLTGLLSALLRKIGL